jgi:hypothetical protein
MVLYTRAYIKVQETGFRNEQQKKTVNRHPKYCRFSILEPEN